MSVESVRAEVESHSSFCHPLRPLCWYFPSLNTGNPVLRISHAPRLEPIQEFPRAHLRHSSLIHNGACNPTAYCALSSHHSYVAICQDCSIF